MNKRGNGTHQGDDKALIAYYNPVEANYCDSVSEGVSNGIKQITSYNERCPDSKIVITSYSQGAHIVSDILGSSDSGTFFTSCTTSSSTPIDPSSAADKKIVTAIIWGDPLHTANQPFNKMSGAGGTGTFPREGDSLTKLNKWTSVFISNCVAEDPICGGGYEIAHHLDFFDLYPDDAAGWVQTQVEAATGSSSSTSSTSATFSISSSKSASATTISTASPSNSTPTSVSASATKSSVLPVSNATSISTSASTITSSKASAMRGSGLALIAGFTATLYLL